MKKSITIFLIIFLLSLTIFLDHFWVVGDAVWGDGKYYYAYAKSLVIDGDLDLKNELQLFSAPIITTRTGLTANKFSIGAAIFWSPFFLLAHLISVGNGYSSIYQVLTGSGTILLGTAGLFFCFLLAKKYFSFKIAFLATLGIFFASNLFFYLVVDPINSHSTSFFVASVFTFMLDKFFSNPKIKSLVIVGLLVGILGMVRSQDLIFIIPAAGFLIIRLFQKKTNFWSFLTNIFTYSGSVFIGFLPQLIVWLKLYGEVKSPYYIHGEIFNWYQPHVFQALFSQNNGLFLYSPILLFGVVGFLFLVRRNPNLGIMALILFLLQTYIISSWHNWWGGAAYGGRMFISLMPLFIIGLAFFFEKIEKGLKYIYPIIILIIILNMVMIINYLLTH